MKKLIPLLALAVTAASANAAPAPVVGATFIGPNDGYIEFINPSFSHYEGGPVCPVGTVEADKHGGCLGTLEWGKPAAPVPLKTALDQQLRPGSYEVIGFAPMGREVVVYYHNLPKKN